MSYYIIYTHLFQPCQRPNRCQSISFFLILQRKKGTAFKRSLRISYCVSYACIGIMTAPSGRIISGVQLPLPNTSSIRAT